jgi:hypothetical protein
MAVLYGILYLLWMGGWLIGLSFKILTTQEHATLQGGRPRRVWQQARIFLGVHLLLFVPTLLLVGRSEFYYGLSDWLAAVLPWSRCSSSDTSYLDQRVFNRAAAMLLSTSSWLYQWLVLGFWLVFNPNGRHRQGVLWGAGITTIAGGLFALWLLLFGFRCGVG